ncbi:DNA adenine methylase [Mannheimia indoligenes]|uniref:DNA adenine methylase n=1 Tax=Mannheimia indoligenes TaxID=3103145 RepID=UPI002FE5ED11
MKKIKKGLLKWAGGKEREIVSLELGFPKTISRYFEPFVGGGSVYLNVNAEQYFINDYYDELAEFYKLVLNNNQELKKYLILLDEVWAKTTHIFSKFSEILIESTRTSDSIYLSTRLPLISADFCSLLEQDKYSALLYEGLDFRKEFEKNVRQKIQRIIKYEQTKGKLSDADLLDNLKTSFKSAIYTYIRAVYNAYRREGRIDEPLFIACFFFIRNYCYSSMFRYNSKNEFNVPYGGISYNENYLGKKIEYLYSEIHQEKYKKTVIENVDFEIFLDKFNYSENDFIFLDPPYDSEFSDYAGNTFSQEDQRRLARFLNSTNAKFLLVIKKTDFIENLYKDSQFNIKIFEKTYQVSFKNRNNRNVEHLVITNF